MSGELMGEVLTARSGYLASLTQAETLALLAIANRCSTDTRQGWVAKSEIQAAIGQSARTTERVLERLTKQGLIAVVKRGYRAHGRTSAPRYELAELPPPWMARAQQGASATLDGESTSYELPPNRDELPPNRDELPPNRPRASATLGGDLDVHTDVHNQTSIADVQGGARARATPPPPPLEFDPEVEPPQTCPRHPYGTTEPCIPCKTARLRHKWWFEQMGAYYERLDEEEAARAAAEPEKPPLCRECRFMSAKDGSDLCTWCEP